jgi:hypothetical protein
MKNREDFLLPFILIGVLLVSGACAVPSTDDASPDIPIDTPYTYITTSQVASSSFQELAQYADIVVIAKVISEEAVINTARDPGDPSKPDTRLFSITPVYTIEVEQFIKGRGANTLNLVQNQGIIILDAQGTRPSPAEIDAVIQENEGQVFISLSQDKRYLMFLRILDEADYEVDGYRSGSLYAGVAEPWRFEITPEEVVVPETVLTDLRQQFPPQPLGDVIEKVNQPFAPGQGVGPYPSPSPEPLRQPSYP